MGGEGLNGHRSGIIGMIDRYVLDSIVGTIRLYVGYMHYCSQRDNNHRGINE